MTAREDYCYIPKTINYVLKQKKLGIFDVLHEFETIADANDRSL